MLTLADVLEALTGARLEGASLVISEASIDSRQTIPAGMFVALSLPSSNKTFLCGSQPMT